LKSSAHRNWNKKNNTGEEPDGATARAEWSMEREDSETTNRSEAEGNRKEKESALAPRVAKCRTIARTAWQPLQIQLYYTQFI